MGFFQRLANLWSGFISLWVSDAEARNPEAVYESAINERIRKHKELKKAVSNIVYLRNKLSGELEEAEKEFREVGLQIPVAVEEGEDEVALVLIEKKKDQLAGTIESLSAELSKVESQAEDAKAGLLSFQGEIEKLRREKEEMLAARANAQARVDIQEALSGLSLDADVQALDNVRESIQKLKAEADVGSELEGESLDAKMAKIRKKSANVAAQAQLDEMKSQLAARKAAAEGAAVKKTM